MKHSTTLNPTPLHPDLRFCWNASCQSAYAKEPVDLPVALRRSGTGCCAWCGGLVLIPSSAVVAQLGIPSSSLQRLLSAGIEPATRGHRGGRGRYAHRWTLRQVELIHQCSQSGWCDGRSRYHRLPELFNAEGWHTRFIVSWHDRVQVTNDPACVVLLATSRPELATIFDLGDLR